MKTGRLIGTVLGVALVFVMIGTMVGSDNGSLIAKGGLIQKASADPSLTTWSRVSAPSTEGWVLTPGSTIIDYAVADGGEVAYAIVGQDDAFHLLRSTNHAATWKDKETTEAVVKEVHKVTGVPTTDPTPYFELWKVACAPDDPDFVAIVVEIATDVYVFISTDGGATFRSSGVVDAGLGGGTCVYHFAISPAIDGVRDIAVAGVDGIWRSRATGSMATAWEDATAYLGWDDEDQTTELFDTVAVVAVQFAPSWDRDWTVLAVTVADWGTSQSVYLQSGTWDADGDGSWNTKANFKRAVRILHEVSLDWQPDPIGIGGLVAGITTPENYAGRTATQRYAWVWVNYKDPANTIDGRAIGEIFRVVGFSVNAIDTQLPGEPWMSNVSYLGTIASGKAIATVLGDGATASTDCCQGVQVYRNDDITGMEICCLRWRPACKPPTGSLGMEASYVSPDKAYAVALWGDAHDEGAWSVSFDDGETWNQLSLVDTSIDYFSDAAVSPDCNKTMLVGANVDAGCGCDSVWFKAHNLAYAPEYSGRWLRTWCGRLENNYGLLRLAPEEINTETVYLVDVGTSRVYWNDRQTLGCWEKGTATVNTIVDLAVQDDASIYALDASGFFTMSDGYGAPPTWYRPVHSGVDRGHSIAVRGSNVLVGGRDGVVAYSADGGATFFGLEDVAADGHVTVAFDSYFDANNVIYVALADAGTDNGIYRWVLGESTTWTNLGAEPYDYTGLVLDNADGNPMTGPATGGVLYASYVSEVDGQIITGVARCLTPAEEVCCDESDWDYLTQGLTSNEAFVMIPRALKICGGLTPDADSKLLAIDGSVPYDTETGTAGAVWSFVDYYAKAAPHLTSPADGATIRADGRSCLNVAFTLRWTCQYDLYVYDLQIAQDKAFTEVILNIQDYEPSQRATPRYLVAKGTLACGTYYWRVRAVDIGTGQTIHSWWSEPRGFAVVHGKP